MSLLTPPTVTEVDRIAADISTRLSRAITGPRVMLDSMIDSWVAAMHNLWCSDITPPASRVARVAALLEGIGVDGAELFERSATLLGFIESQAPGTISGDPRIAAALALRFPYTVDQGTGHVAIDPYTVDEATGELTFS